jgi:plastocyanin/mono/diheme cytochrome c family protein
MKSLERGEAFALIALILILVGLPVAALGYQFTLRPVLADVRTIDIVAAAPEKGGFQPESIRVAAGETVRLRFSVPDVTHGIAIGPGLDLDIGHVDPGQVEEVEVTFDKPGRYSFYCNSWCSLNHWRMRGTIDVYDPTNPSALIVNDVTDPVLDALIARHVDIDAPHRAGATPLQRPSEIRGSAVVARLGDELPSQLADPMWRRSHSPFEAWIALTDVGVPEVDAWAAVAYLWLADKDEIQLEKAALLYAKNCAACHGENGDGHGPGADALMAQGVAQDAHMGTSGTPAAFTDPELMLGGTSEVYYAKLRRGGMGTGMPGFGSLFTPDETWALVDFLWTFAFDE